MKHIHFSLKKQSIKKAFLSFLFIFIADFCFAFTQEDIKIFTLESGLTLYFLQDTTTATVRLELNINASSLCQSPQTAGFFSLYAKLSGLEMTADCVKTEKTVAPSQTEQTLIEFSNYYKLLNISDKALEQQLKKEQSALTEFSSSTAGFINQTIDTCIFDKEPWKQESAVYPKLFNSTSPAQARAILNQIKNNYYTPSNSTLYISGNITSETALLLAEKYFGKFSPDKNPSAQGSNSTILFSPATAQISKAKKYVLTDDSISGDLTQIVLQYTQLDQDKSDLLSAVFNKNNSTFKTLLLKQRNLAIRAPDYIDCSSAQQSNSSRLIIQAICEKTKVSPAVQAELFLEMSKEKERLTQIELANALKEMQSNFTLVTNNSTLLMKNLAIFNQTNKDFSENLFNKNERLKNFTAEQLNSQYEEAQPFVFVLCSTADYLKYQKEFKKYGYTRLTSKNGAWYLQPKYRDFIQGQNSTASITKEKNDDTSFSASRFIQENESQISSFTLKNEIPVTVKYTPKAQRASLMLAINGGELLFAQQNPGLMSLLANSLASIIQYSLDSLYQNQVLQSPAKVTSQTDAQYSLLTVNCQSQDILTCLNTMSSCVIFGDITPSLADAITYDLRTQWKIKSGSADFQLLCEAARTIYKNKEESLLFNDTKDRPSALDFTQIQSAYPKILDSTRFSLILTGGIPQESELKKLLDSNFGELNTFKATQNINKKMSQPALPKKTKKLQLRHQFFTDISADKAGPRPAILIPTTDFSDPLLYVLDAPDNSTTDSALFNALLYLLQNRLQKALDAQTSEQNNQLAKVTPADSDFPYAQVVITKIKHTSRTDSLYAKTVRSISTELKELINQDKSEALDTQKADLLVELENLWLLRELEKTSTTEGTAFLLHKGQMYGRPKLYLEQYKAVSTANAEDFYLVFNSYFQESPALKVYSADSKQ